MRSRGIDVTHHVSSPLSVEMINQADRIFAMTRGHVETIMSMAPSSAGKVTLLGQRGDIEDPLGKGLEDYEACAREMESALAVRLQEIEP
jgi:protein-tyrosine phosphatase